MRHVTARLTYANIVATLALFIALGGTAWAAATIGSAQIVDNSVASVDIADNNVKSRDVRDGTISTLDIANGTIKGADVRKPALGGAHIVDGSIELADLSPAAREALTGPVELADISPAAREALTSAPVDGDQIVDGTLQVADLSTIAREAVILQARKNPVLTSTSGDYTVTVTDEAGIVMAGPEGTITFGENAITIDGTMAVHVKSGTAVNLLAPQVRAYGSSLLDLRAPLILLNGGCYPVARAGDSVNTTRITSGSATVKAC